MKVDVSDLFDHFYDVAEFARARFDLAQTVDSGLPSDEWLRFCDSLSDSLFLTACANRAFAITHTRISAAEVKPRVIAESSPQTGEKTLFCRYAGPYFAGRPQFLATVKDRGGSCFTRPRHKLTLWLGKLPPYEIAATPPVYPPDLAEPIRYFARQYFAMHGNSPTTHYFEFHGFWCLRRVQQYGASFTRSAPGGQWLRVEDIMEITSALFEEVWHASTDDQRD